MIDYGLPGRSIVVTGGASGIGRAVAIALAREGARVAVADLNRDGGEETIALIRDAGGEAVFIETDVAQSASVQAMVAQTVAAFGRLDGAFNNAALHPGHARLVDFDEQDWDVTVGADQSGVFLCMKYQIRQMLAQGGGGAIVNTSSTAGVAPLLFAPAYSAAKSAVLAMTRYAAVEYGPDRIRVNAVIPGAILTPLLEARIAFDPERSRKLAEGMSALGRIGDPAELADAVLWLLSDRSSFVTGAALPVDGGATAK